MRVFWRKVQKFLQSFRPYDGDIIRTEVAAKSPPVGASVTANELRCKFCDLEVWTLPGAYTVQGTEIWCEDEEACDKRRIERAEDEMGSLGLC